MVPRQINNGMSPMQAWEERQALELDGAVITPGFAYNIARYFPSGTDYDKQMCIELMDKIGASTNPSTWYSPVARSRTPTRPKSDPSSRNRQPRNATQSRTKDTEHFYMTTNQREYRGVFGSPAGSVRPRTSEIFPVRSNNNSSSYRTDFNQKYLVKTQGIRAATTSGNRRNNPHPFETFINWKFPSRLPPVLSEEINPDAWNEVLKEQVKSTYQYDYTGIPQGVDVSTVFSGDLVPSLYQPPYTLDSTARCSYQAPPLRNELSENLSQRFGCNRNIYKPAVGAGKAEDTSSTFMINLK
ncbi:hypothetical protein P5673_013641 [Acropora cervicornis]|uniref:Uncharacterized protein n=1 Tax=Acropora cervicornis TaxID=6130 RepID=A0AAD9QL38_ACRCE|nr:hypothetical protein P5673_013641 [Acropora cervicornis]